MIIRKSEFKKTAKYWLLPDIRNRIKEGKITVSFNSEVCEIKKDEVVYIDKKTKEILRKDTIDCKKTIPKKSNILFLTMNHDYNPIILGNKKIKSMSIEQINTILHWQPTYILFADSTELTENTF